MKHIICFCLYRVLLPLVLLTATIFRFNAFSFIYLILLFVCPLVPAPTIANIASGHTERYLKSIIGLSMVIAIGQISFQGAMFGLGLYFQGDYCSWDRRLYGLIGFHTLDGIKVLDAIRLVGLDYVVILTSVATLIACEKFYVEEPRPAEETNMQESSRCHVRQRKKPKKEEFLITFCEILVLVFMAGAGILVPSLTSAVYFLTFLAVCTWLACDRKLKKAYLYSKIPIAIFCALHFTALYLYQFDYVQEYIPKSSLYARLLGIVGLVHIDCKNPRTLIFENESWTKFVSPLFILGLYWLLVVTARLKFAYDALEESYRGDGVTRGDSIRSSQHSTASGVRHRKQRRNTAGCLDNMLHDSWEKPDETSALLSEDHTAQSYKAVDPVPQKDTLAIDPNGSIIWRSESECHDGSTAVVPGDETATVTSGATGRYRRVLSPLVTLFKFAAKGSYIPMLIIMMTWSIKYHSWLTFVLLLWSCILWMTPNSRKACLRWSPAIVAYAEALLLLQYIYCLDLNDNELPRQIENVNLAQIGLVKYGDMSYQPLAIKILCTVMFWITLHQYMEERHRINRRDIAEGVMMEPFNISYGTSQPGYPRPDLRRQMSIATSGATAPNPYIRKIADTIHHLLAKFWIWIVACMLMVISLGDQSQKVVVYRIVYMFLFLLFILIFQFSYQLWRRIIYGFWLTVIVFSMLVLILIYTYQFENFPKYWDRLGISPEIQSDIGLEVYKSDPGTLFIKLLTPTFFLIITIIQLHYFHKEFLNISDINYRSTEELQEQATQVTSTSIIPIEDAQAAPVIVEPEVAENQLSSAVGSDPTSQVDKIPEEKETQAVKEYKAFQVCIEAFLHKAVIVFHYVSEFCWRVLEIHIIKIILFSVMCLAISDVCAVHFLYVVLVIIALPFRALQTFLCHCMSIWTAILLLSKMIYQLQVVDQYGWKVNCTNETGWLPFSDNEYPFNETIDNREWIGFKKTKYLADYCKGYIGLILVLTIQAVVKIRQKVFRYHFSEPEPKPGIIFSDSTRAKADNNLTECFKYFCNYFFYKFGLEFTFVTIVICIGVRLDAFAVISGLWLLIMFMMKRQTISKIWPIYISFQTIFLVIQYIMCVGIPPGLCTAYPWTTTLNKQLQVWLFLPDFINPPSSCKILVDFFQVLFACCQLHVFKIEKGPAAEMYEGGSNKEIVYEVHSSSSAPNPIPDFVSHKHSYLDMLKVFAFFAFYWMTLAIVFLAGTTQVNIFAIGYVIGCFFFLWNGNEFYLKPIKDLLKWWNGLICYNLIVIYLKLLLQLVGCVYMSDIPENCCWLVQLFGISCIKTWGFGTESGSKGSKCSLPPDTVGLLWDSICFAFLLLQKRLFCSYYFQHLVNEVRAQQVLASRGAELIHEIQMKEVQEQEAGEREIMEKIKKKMDHIKAYQQKVRGGDNVEPDTHFQAIRSGDYYMFDEYFDEEIDLELSTSYRREVVDENTAEVRQRGLTALLSKAIRQNLLIAPDGAKKDSGESDDVGESSQQSAIVSADRTPLSRSISRASQRFLSPQASRRSQDTIPSTTSRLTSTTIPSVTEDTVQAAIPEEQEQEEDLAEPKQAETLIEKIKQWMEFAKEFIESALISGTAKLNAVSKDYRFVAYHLANEKKVLKQKYIINGEFDVVAAEADLKSRELSSVLPEICVEGKAATITSQVTSKSFKESMDVIDKTIYDDPEFKKGHPAYIRFIVACYYAAISRSEFLCYMMIIGNQMRSSSILSLPLPLMAFLWGTLSVPRPTKSFWITIITYTEAIVVIKYMFRFNFLNWTVSSRIDPFSLPRIFGVVTRDEYAALDLALLLVVFFHRFMLKSLGLWKDSERSCSASASSITTPKTHETENDTAGVASPSGPAIMKPVDEGDDKDEGEVKQQDDEFQDLNGECEEPEAKGPDIAAVLAEILKPMKSFYRHLLYPEYRVTVDVYAYMFFCDFINFLIVVFGYWAFGTAGTEEGVTSYFEENKVPIPFLIMLAAQFALIVIDRALYLRKYILGKLLFQIVLVFIVHLWMFFVLPAVTLREFSSSHNLPPKLWYFIKCLYLLLSAYQIRSGYPTRILGNFFCKKYNYINLLFFKGYMLVPFLYELRCLMDWMWTNTSMTVGMWLKMEDIYANIFVLKCFRRAEEEYPTPRGAKRTSLVKYGMGGILLFVIILIIWFPLLLFALGNTVGVSNQPFGCTMQLSVGGYEPIFKMGAQQSSITPFDKNEWDKMIHQYSNDPTASDFLANFDRSDVTLIELNGNSTSIWTISPPSQDALSRELRNKSCKIKMKATITFYRDGKSPEVDNEISNSYEIGLPSQEREQLADIISKINNITTVEIANIFPTYLRVPGKGKVSLVKSLDNEGSPPFRDLILSLRSDSLSNLTSEVEYWEVQENCSKYAPYKYLSKGCESLTLVAFSNKVFPSELSLISGYGIVGLYTTFVLVVSRLVRSVIAGSSYTIMFDDMPYVDRVLQLCLDIYLVRESGEFTLEEDLFAKLIFLYRSPETLIRWTRYPDQP